MQVLKNTEIEDGRQDGKEENLQEVNDVHSDHNPLPNTLQIQHLHTLTRDGHKCGTPRRLALASFAAILFAMVQVTRYEPHAERFLQLFGAKCWDTESNFIG